MNRTSINRIIWPVFTISFVSVLADSLVLYRRAAIPLYVGLGCIAVFNICLGLLLSRKAYR